MAVILWLAVAFIAGVIEAVTVTLVSVWLAIGAAIAAAAAFFGAGSGAQCMIFIITSLVLLVLTAPLCSKFRIQKKTPTNADMLIGETAIVTEKIDTINGTGEVRAGGLKWSAKTENGEVFDVGEAVIVEKIVGVHLVVKEAKEV